jgi:predicted nucleic acid-binding protein
MQPALFDTSIYIASLCRGNDATITIRRIADNAPLWLSSVVLEELYAGAGDRERRVVERLERDFDRLKRILVPKLSDWTLTGRVLACIMHEEWNSNRIVDRAKHDCDECHNLA